ncbi:hypothetical protein KNU02_gp92 [Gordonia phage Pleakley]|uniref:Uncharacterized protein n=1 Tax=Gordonia phage Pleakley TaxID=2283246 RepID=A0A345M6L0_9CAUD|nr:hypothetical protein KNU02_gp92 [Gordonia phage Pleakley]AXH49817.1 hypothetical protein SEA_FURY_92 [Gordonia phage Fury]AXH66131.1 hypothetical protein SEA_PLEAKLEY_92 [Gordonia phage Pleakley]
MTSTYTLELTDIERACGVTLDQVADVLPKVALRENWQERAVWVPDTHNGKSVGPALAGAVARAALAGPVEFRSSRFGVLVYVPDYTPPAPPAGLAGLL